MIFSIVKRIPKYFVLISLFVTTFLLSFLLLGCIDVSNTYSQVFLTKFQFNQSSPLFPNVNASYTRDSKNSSLADMSIRVGYLGLCVNLAGNLTCTSYSAIGELANSTGLNLIPTTSKDNEKQLNLTLLAATFNRICHPRILMTAVIMTLLILAIMLYGALYIVPGKLIARKIVCFLSIVNVLVWGLGSMLQHEAVNTAVNIVGPSSMGLIQVVVGKRAEAMTWTAFTFILILSIESIFQVYKDLKVDKTKIDMKV